MNAITKPHFLTMSSREIADLVESRHDKVKQSMERLADRGIISFTPSGENPNEKGGRPGTVYLVNKRDSYIVVAQLSPEFTARLVDRWQELESQNAIDPAKVLNDPAAMRGLLLTYTEKVIALEQRVDSLAPKAEALDRISGADGALNVTETAKVLGLRPLAMFTYLKEHKWIYKRPGGKNWLGYQERIQQGLLDHKVTTLIMPDGSDRVNEQVLVTPKGIAKLAALLGQEAA